ncbi:hypothetical protein Droror1_Dr00021959 [Drosera rotundifolia]
MKCPYCSATSPGRCATTISGRPITDCATCGRAILEHQTLTQHHHHLFHLRATDSPLLLSTSDLPTPPSSSLSNSDSDSDSDPFNPTGFITAFSTFSLTRTPVYAVSSVSFSGHLAELERALEGSVSNSTSHSNGGGVVVDNLRAYLQVVDVASILGLDHDISDHAFQLFRDCSSATCLRNRSVEALATACLVQAIREAQEPRTLQEISIAANVPQKEIGKYIKILGEALQLSQPINSNSISVHMPRFCNLLQLNKSAQELATHIGEVVMNKCFCTRRNPISISAAAIYLACQLEDMRKTQAEICKVTGLTEVTLRKVYKELLENWDHLLPPNYTPVVPPEKAFPTTTIPSGRSSTPRGDPPPEVAALEKEKPPETIPSKPGPIPEASHQGKQKEDSESKGNPNPAVPSKPPSSWQPGLPFGINVVKKSGDNNQSAAQGVDIAKTPQSSHEAGSGSMKSDQVPKSSSTRPLFSSGSTSHMKMMLPGQYSLTSATAQEQLKGPGNQGGGKGPDHNSDK